MPLMASCRAHPVRLYFGAMAAQNGTSVSVALNTSGTTALDAFLPAAYSPANLTLAAGQPVLLEAAHYNNGINGFMAVSGWWRWRRAPAY